MAPLFSLIRDINPSKTTWAIRLRLVRAYEVPVYRRPTEILSFDCVFHDREGERIHATMKGAVMNNLQPSLIEGHLFAVKDFIVAENRMKYKTTSNKFTLIFFKKTKITEFFDEEFPTSLYQIRSFSSFAGDQEIAEFELFDIIGKVVSYQLPPLTQKTQSRRMDFKIEDLENNRLLCTLWEEYIDSLLPHLENEKNVVVLIQFARAKLFGDDIKISNTYYATKIIVNGDSSEFKPYKMKILETPESSNSIRIFSEKATYSVSEEFSSGNAIVRTLAQIKESNKDVMCWVDATIVDIETVGECWYIACKRCSRKLLLQDSVFHCPRCGLRDSKGEYRYKIEVRVVDGTGNARFQLWDKECVHIIGKTATEIKSHNVDNKDLVPREIEDALIDKRALFKVQVKDDAKFNFCDVYTVIKMTDDAAIMSMHHEKYVDSQESDDLSKLHNFECEEKDPDSKSINAENIDMRHKSEDDILNGVIMKRNLNDELSAVKGDNKKLKMVIKKEK